jgi:hypothetical protein
MPTEYRIRRRIRKRIPAAHLDRTRGPHRDNLGIVALAIVTTLAVGAGPVMAGANHSTNPVFSLADFGVVGTSTLVRTDGSVSVTLDTTALSPGHVVTLWWAVFNNPVACTHGIPGVSRCGEPDLFNTDPDGPQGSLLYAAGRVIDDDGTAGYGAHLKVGDTTGVLSGPGLLDARAAEVILVLRSHGPKIPDLLSEMLSTFGAGCKDAPPGTGTRGPNDCAEVQVSAHTP